MAIPQVDSDFLRYLLDHGYAPGSRLPSLNQISNEIGISVGKLREQLEGARTLGLVEARPRLGIECNGYRFEDTINQSLLFALNMDQDLFASYSALRAKLEIAFWDEAVSRLTAADRQDLLDLVDQAWAKLEQPRIQIPHAEHRQFHLAIFRRLDNPFVTGLLAAYWDAYEAVELNTYADYSYLTAVWDYHRQIAQAIAAQEFELARQLHQDHMQLLTTRGQTAVRASPNGHTHGSG